MRLWQIACGNMKKQGGISVGLPYKWLGGVYRAPCNRRVREGGIHSTPQLHHRRVYYVPLPAHLARSRCRCSRLCWLSSTCTIMLRACAIGSTYTNWPQRTRERKKTMRAAPTRTRERIMIYKHVFCWDCRLLESRERSACGFVGYIEATC